MNVHVYGVDLLSVIIRSAFAYHTQASPQASWCGGLWVITRSQIWYSCRVKQRVPAILLSLVTPRYYNFFEGSWCAFSTGQRMSTYCCCDATCSSWCTTTALASKIPRSVATWTRMVHDKAGTYSFSRACYNNCRIATTVARCLEVYRRMTFCTFMTVFMRDTCLCCR